MMFLSEHQTQFYFYTHCKNQFILSEINCSFLIKLKLKPTNYKTGDDRFVQDNYNI